MLKKTIGFTLCTLALASMHSAPALAQGGVGGKIGVNFANISLDPEDPDITNKTTRTGLVAGLYGMLQVAGAFHIQAEGLYSQQGFTADIDGIDATLALDYIQVPLLAKFLIPTDGSVMPGFYAGPVASFEVSCGLSGEVQGTTIEQDCDDPNDGVIRSKSDFGLLFGGEIDFVAGGALITLEVRYNLGLKDLDPEANSSGKQRVLSVLAGVGFYSPGS